MIIEGKGGIKANVVADSITAGGSRITTFELEYPRFIHAEFMTHRMFSRNAASSRAIPVKRSIELIKERTARPIHWGKNQPGMTAKEECDTLLDSCADFAGCTREEWWDEARDMAIIHAKEFDARGYHKQIVNRLLEPFSFIKVVCTATEYDNFFNLRLHADAQPEINELARCMYEAMIASDPVGLKSGEWHVPYYKNGQWSTADDISLEDALAVSASCCAQVSYRRLDDSIEKARDIFKRLIESKPAHASPMEHQATPIALAVEGVYVRLPMGCTHIDISGNYWSGNFCGWVQHRQTIPDTYCVDFVRNQAVTTQQP